MNANVLDQMEKSVPMTMGCYGIGITRIVAAAIEQNHDDNSIIWPSAMAPSRLSYSTWHGQVQISGIGREQCTQI